MADTISDLVISKSTTYLGETPSALAVDYAIEKFKQVRNYPPHFTSDDIESDLQNNLATISMAVVDLVSKVGAEGETSHNSSGTSRAYENAYVSLSVYSDVIPFVTCFE